MAKLKWYMKHTGYETKDGKLCWIIKFHWLWVLTKKIQYLIATKQPKKA